MVLLIYGFPIALILVIAVGFAQLRGHSRALKVLYFSLSPLIALLILFAVERAIYVLCVRDAKGNQFSELQLKENVCPINYWRQFSWF